MSEPTSDADQLARLRLENQRLEQLLAQARAQGFAPEAEPPPCPVAPPDQPAGTQAKLETLWLWFGLGTIVLIILFAFTTCGRPSTPGAPATVAEAPSAPVAPTPPAAPPPPPKIGSQWTYTDQEEDMGGKTRTACVTSDDMVRLSFPYGPQHARFCVRNSPKYGLDTYFSLEDDGQILCSSYSRCHIRVRFDDKPAQSWPGTDASDGSSNIVFLTRSQRLVASVKAAKRMRIELEYYQNGTQSVSFNTEGLDW